MYALLKIDWKNQEVSVLMVDVLTKVAEEMDRLMERNLGRSYSVSYVLRIRKVGD